jgi:hypothetical protein
MVPDDVRRTEPTPVVAPEAKDLDARVFLIGDAGVPLENDPVLVALGKDVGADPARSVVVYLGDNVYPRGLPQEGSLGRKEAERRLDAQVDAADEGSLVLFVPGNHDWDKHSAAGWDAVRRQGEYLAAKGASMEPTGGCPGPAVRDVNDQVRLVLLDTQWWLHAGPKPVGKDSPCRQKTERDVVDALAAAIRDAGARRVVVAAHHPLATGGSHGGYFSWRDHLFPLRAAKSWLWIPLPGIGSLYPGARRAGWGTEQDVGSPANRRMREALAGVFEKHPPLVYAAGHEHNLQVLEAPHPRVLLVSGAGAYGHVTQTSWTASTLFARAASGYMRLDVEKSGRVRLAVVTVAADGKATEAMALDLTSGAPVALEADETSEPSPRIEPIAGPPGGAAAEPAAGPPPSGPG